MNGRMSSALLATGLLATTIAPATLDKPAPLRGVLVYSTLCQGSEDAGGEQVTIIRSPEGNTVVYEYTEGPIMAPLLAFGPNVDIDERTRRIRLSFMREDTNEAVILQGTISDEALDIKESVTGRYLHLARLLQFAQKLPSCEP